MKIFVSTQSTQGDAPGDFCFELEWRAHLFQTLCDTGWASAMSATDLAEVVDDLVEHDLGAAAALPVGLIVGRRAWNSRGATVDHLTDRGLAAPGMQRAS